MLATPITRGPEDKWRLSAVFKKSLNDGTAPKGRLFAVCLEREMPMKDMQDICLLKESTVIANVRQPLGHKGRHEYIQITKNEGSRFSMIIVSPTEERLHRFAFFTYRKKEYFVAAPKNVAVSYGNMAARLEGIVCMGNGKLRLVDGGSIRFFIEGSLSEPADIYKRSIQAKAARTIESVMEPATREIQSFAGAIGVDWLADRLASIRAK